MRKTNLYFLFTILLLFINGFSHAEGNSIGITRTTKHQVNKQTYSTVKIAYPVIKNITQSKELNAEISKVLDSIEANFKKNLGANQPLKPIPELPATVNSNTLDVDYKVLYTSRNFISIRFSIYTFFYGAAHPYTTFQSLNYDIKQGKVLSLADVFKSNDYLSFLATYSKGALTEKLSKAASNQTEPFPEGINPTSDNYAIWNFTSKGLLLTFPASQVAAYVFGPQEVTIPHSAMKDMLRVEWH